MNEESLQFKFDPDLRLYYGEMSSGNRDELVDDSKIFHCDLGKLSQICALQTQAK